VSLGDVISIDWHGAETGLKFLKEAEGALIPMAAVPVPRSTAVAVGNSEGRFVGEVWNFDAAGRRPLR
jgi:hypothetical protein